MIYVKKYEVNETSKDHLTYKVTINTDAWKKATDEAVKKESEHVKIKGFRDGKAPVDVARKHVDMAKVFDEAIRSLLNPALREVIEDSKITPLIIPSFNPVATTEDELVLEYSIILLPEIKIGQYKGLKIEKEAAEVSEHDVEHSIEHLLKDHAHLHSVEKAVENGDIAILDFEGFHNGVAFDGGKAENHELEIGSQSFIPGFEEQIVGHKAGEEFDIKVTFPENYQAENLKGQEVTFKIKLHEVKVKHQPELNDEFAKGLDIPEVNTVEELKAHQKKELLSQKERDVTGKYINKILETIKETSEIPVYEEYIERVVNDDLNNYAQQIQQQIGGTLEDYLKMTGTKEEDFFRDLHDNAVKQYEIALVVNKIINDEKIIVTDEEVEFELAKMAEAYKMEIDQLKQVLAPQLNQFRNDLLNRRFEEFILENNK